MMDVKNKLLKEWSAFGIKVTWAHATGYAEGRQERVKAFGKDQRKLLSALDENEALSKKFLLLESRLKGLEHDVASSKENIVSLEINRGESNTQIMLLEEEVSKEKLLRDGEAHLAEFT